MADNGPGIADSIRDRLFHPFVSYGKENGTGLGLAVVLKIVQDHGGEIVMERTGPVGDQGLTVFRIVLPARLPDGYRSDIPASSEVPSLVPVPAQLDDSKQNSISHPGP